MEQDNLKNKIKQFKKGDKLYLETLNNVCEVVNVAANKKASDFDIKDLADSSGLMTKWEGKQDAIVDLGEIRENSKLGLSAFRLFNDLYTSITYAALFSLRNSKTLSPGTTYRITDYICTVANYSNAKAINEGLFDILVTAIDKSTLSEDVKFIYHEGDTYFSGSRLESWEGKYSLVNHTTRFDWADATNGKGVIYWLKDAWGNECSYDFKNIQFKRTVAGVDNWYYTFGGTSDNTLHSGTTFSNIIKPNQSCQVTTSSNGLITYSLNNNVFGIRCSNNLLDYNCSNNTFGDGCCYNVLSEDCYGNNFGRNCNSNTFGINCNSNSIEDSSYNTFGKHCDGNLIVRDSNHNTFGNACEGNTIGRESWYNTFGNGCYANTIYECCHYNTFGNGCNNNTFDLLRIHECTFGDNVEFCMIGGYEENNLKYLKNIIILNGTRGTYGHLLDLGVNGIFNNNFVSKDSNVPHLACGFNSEGEYVVKNLLDNECDNLVVSVTWRNLRDLRDGGLLIPGITYRLTDYMCYVDSNKGDARGVHPCPFDILIVSDDVNNLNENVRFTNHVTGTHLINIRLESWEGKYCIDNDISRFAWANGNGKGVIYWLKDEWNNECPYDFKNIQFKRTVDGVDNWYHTFGGANDDSLNGLCRGNVIKEFTTANALDLNNIIFGTSCCNNKFEQGCAYNTFDIECSNNTFGNDCIGNTFGKNCLNNTFGDHASGNTFGTYCLHNVFGNDCCRNKIGNYYYNNTFGNSCSNNGFDYVDYVRYCNFENGVQSCYLDLRVKPDLNNYLQNVIVLNGTYNRDLTDLEIGKNYHQACGHNSEGEYVVKNLLDDSNIEQLVTSITWSELHSLKDGGSLIPGMTYRITDYMCIVSKDNVDATHAVLFDILVIADDEYVLNENVRFTCHDRGDNYVNHDFDAWEGKYCIDNDTTRFDWADRINGKGVIYWLKDEWGNECPYDFKNIRFERTVNGVNYMYYTFSHITTLPNGDLEITDGSLRGFSYSNIIKPYLIQRLETIIKKQVLNNIVLGDECCNNTFENDCYNNTLGNNCHNNIFGVNCYNNVISDNSNSNVFGNGCSNNELNHEQIKLCVFGNNVQYCTIDGYSTIVTDRYIKNIIVLDNTCGNEYNLLNLGENHILDENTNKDINVTPHKACGFNSSDKYVVKNLLDNDFDIDFIKDYVSYHDGHLIKINNVDRIINCNLHEGDNIRIDSDGRISATDTTYTAGTNITIDDDGVISATDTTYIAGNNVIIDGNVISVTDTIYTAGDFIDITNGVITTTYSEGDNITIDANGKINATDTKYTAGTNVKIDGNVISATDTKYTAGTNVTIDNNGVISATDTTYTAGTNVKIDGNGVISATDTKYTAGDFIDITNGVITTTYSEGTNITIDDNGVISATDTKYTAGTNVKIDGNVISATDTTYTAGTNVKINGNVISATDTTYTAGAGIKIIDNVISATGTGGGGSCDVPTVQHQLIYSDDGQTLTTDFLMKENFHVVDNEEDFEKCKGYFEENPPIHGMGNIVYGDADGNGAWEKGYINSEVTIDSTSREWVYNKNTDTIDATNNTDYPNYFIDKETHYYINNIANIGYFSGDTMNDSIGVIFYTEFTGEDGEKYCDYLTVECGNRVKQTLNNSVNVGVSRRKKSATNNNDSSNLIKYFQLVRSQLTDKTFGQSPYLVRGDELVKVTATGPKQTYFTAVNTVKKGKTIAFYFSEKAFNLSVANKQQDIDKNRSVIFDLDNYRVQINGYDGTNTPFSLNYDISTTPMSYNTDAKISEPHPTQWDDGDDITDIWRNIAENGRFGYFQTSTPEGRVYNIQYIEGDNVVYNNLILRNDTNEVYELNGSTFDVLSGSIPVDYFTGSHISYNDITEKLWYSNGTEITQIATNCSCGEGSDSNNPGSDITCNCIEYSGGTNIEIVDGVINCTLSALTTDLITKVTYNDLCGLINSKTLTPGMKYRITDYVTTVNTSLTDVQSAGHVFDIIVEATDVDKLSENAKAIQSVRDVDGYFAEVNLDAWELKYSVDNDTDRFTWADRTNGKGVIYYMKDEHNNECPYDFKNIQFKRVAISNIEATGITSHLLSELQTTFVYGNNGGICYGQVNRWGSYVPRNVIPINGGTINYTFDNDIQNYYYTFTWVDNSGDVKDASVVGQRLTNDEGHYSGVFNNQIQPVSQFMFYPDSPNEFGYSLNNIVFVSDYLYDGGYFYGCYGNKFGVNCWGNTFGNKCQYNTFGSECYENTFGDNCDSNTFGNHCKHNTFGNYCEYNIFGNRCDGNTFGSDCNYNTFGTECNTNTIGNCFQYNTFGNWCNGNTLGNWCNGNTLGNCCQGNTLETDYMFGCRFGDDVKNCTISGYTTSVTNCLKNIIVLNGTQGTASNELNLGVMILTDDSGNTYNQQVFNRNIVSPNAIVPSLTCGLTWDSNDNVIYMVKNTFELTLL